MPSDLTPNDTVSPCFGGENIMLEWKWGETNTYDIDNIISDIGEFLNYVKTGDITWSWLKAWTYQAKEFCSYARPDVHFNQLYMIYSIHLFIDYLEITSGGEILEKNISETLSVCDAMYLVDAFKATYSHAIRVLKDIDLVSFDFNAMSRCEELREIRALSSRVTPFQSRNGLVTPPPTSNLHIRLPPPTTIRRNIIVTPRTLTPRVRRIVSSELPVWSTDDNDDFDINNCELPDLIDDTASTASTVIQHESGGLPLMADERPVSPIEFEESDEECVELRCEECGDSADFDCEQSALDCEWDRTLRGDGNWLCDGCACNFMEEENEVSELPPREHDPSCHICNRYIDIDDLNTICIDPELGTEDTETEQHLAHLDCLRQSDETFIWPRLYDDNEDVIRAGDRLRLFIWPVGDHPLNQAVMTEPLRRDNVDILTFDYANYVSCLEENEWLEPVGIVRNGNFVARITLPEEFVCDRCSHGEINLTTEDWRLGSREVFRIAHSRGWRRLSEYEPCVDYNRWHCPDCSSEIGDRNRINNDTNVSEETESECESDDEDFTCGDCGDEMNDEFECVQDAVDAEWNRGLRREGEWLCSCCSGDEVARQEYNEQLRREQEDEREQQNTREEMRRNRETNITLCCDDCDHRVTIPHVPGDSHNNIIERAEHHFNWRCINNKFYCLSCHENLPFNI
tara:strand:+ start:116 stop:2173 length:2058 start_codon:yes stop_codon:yes gene_type:complete